MRSILSKMDSHSSRSPASSSGGSSAVGTAHAAPELGLGLAPVRLEHAVAEAAHFVEVLREKHHHRHPSGAEDAHLVSERGAHVAIDHSQRDAVVTRIG